LSEEPVLVVVARAFFDCASGMAAVLEEAMRRGAGSVGDDDVAARRAEEAGEFIRYFLGTCCCRGSRAMNQGQGVGWGGLFSACLL
jgi:hypothetical protein